ncbi:zinc ABC transporter substrate-binding protein [Candidatus Pelagibacter sp.]|nr:zinc ABC transporter substrate-binding protein [Candidatus Pelagibacter sp.]
MKKIHLISTLIGLLAFSTLAKADLKVVTSIKPIHSLASYIMDGVGSPGLIVDGYNSPHSFQLKPSHAKMLEQADIIFWIGEDLENFLEKPLATIAKKAEKIELLEIKGIKKLKFRERNIFEEHEGHDDHGDDAKKEEHDDHGHDAKKEEHDDHGHDAKKEEHDDHGHDAKKEEHDDHGHDAKKEEHDDHGHDAKKEEHDDHGHDAKKEEHDDHGHDAKKEEHDDHGHDAKKEEHDDHEGHGHGEYDPHIWLDPINAKVILNEITEHLIENDSKNAATYKSNLAKALAEIDKLIIDVITETNTDLSYVVFHDAYQYYENRFNVNILGAMTVNPDVMPGAEQIHEIHEVIEHDNVSCILSEPQFNPDIIKSIAKDTSVKTGVLDPLGANLKPGKDLYFDLIRNMSASFNC